MESKGLRRNCLFYAAAPCLAGWDILNPGYLI